MSLDLTRELYRHLAHWGFVDDSLLRQAPVDEPGICDSEKKKNNQLCLNFSSFGNDAKRD